MTNMEALTNMVNSENAPVIAGIGGIVLLILGRKWMRRLQKDEKTA